MRRGEQNNIVLVKAFSSGMVAWVISCVVAWCRRFVVPYVFLHRRRLMLRSSSRSQSAATDGFLRNSEATNDWFLVGTVAMKTCEQEIYPIIGEYDRGKAYQREPGDTSS